MTRPRKSRAQRSASAKVGALARWHPAKAKKAAAATAAARKPKPFDGPLDSIADYDDAVGKPETWQDAKARESLVGELLKNEQLRHDLEVNLGKLLTREQVAERDRLYDEQVLSALGKIPDAMAEHVDPERRNDARARGRELIAEIRRAIVAGVGPVRT